MNYVVLDMEWNQPGYSDTALCRNGVCMKNEIIQIGAVKLAEDMSTLGTFQCIIKPVSLTEMNKVIKQLTGITDEMLDKGESFFSAIERFRSFCGEDYVLLIWGYDDIRILKNNLSFHGADLSWLPKGYNLQMIFCDQTNNEKRQFSLEYALEYYEIEVKERLHDAYNDAEYTAEVCKKLDIKGGIEKLNTMPVKEEKKDESKNYLVKRKFRHIRKREEIWANSFVTRPACPCCGGKMKFEKPVYIGQHRIHIEGKCEKDGAIMTVLKISETPEKTFSVCQQMYTLDNKAREYFEGRAKKRRRKRVPKKTLQHNVNAEEKTDEGQL